VGRKIRARSKNFRKNFPICLGKLLKQNHRPAKLFCSFSSQWRKNSGELKIFCHPKAKGSRTALIRAESVVSSGVSLRAVIRGITTGGQGAQLPGRRMTAGGAEKSQQCHKYFNAIHLLPKDLMFEHGSAKLPSCPGRHLTSLRP